ncbi:MAG TPA: glycosyltransferase [Acidobacteriota bacterium]|nr:glycosyltransferase [Acidobacteriota bacterium]
MKVLIVGLAKSGTSALTQRIKISTDAESYFEDEKVDFSKKKNIVCKILFNKHFTAKFNTWENFVDSFVPKFDKIILIIRDPRDRLISRVLFRTQYITDADKFEEFMKLLAQKETKPSLIPMRKLAELADPDLAEEYTDKMYTLKSNPKVFVLKYEDFVDNKVASLESFLSVELKPILENDKRLERLERTKSYNNWKDWFTPEDVKLYKPQFQKFMQDFGYYDKWELNDIQKILPQHATLYVNKLIKMTNENKLRVINNEQVKREQKASSKNLKLLIIGLPKSGTSALYYRLLNSIPNVDGYFEKDQIKFNVDKNILVKVVFVPKLLSSFNSMDSFKAFVDQFDKIIFICRDPRDRLISILLYGLRHIPQRELALQILELIKIKEKNPALINTKELSNLAKIYYPLEYAQELTLLENKNNTYKLKYEDFVDNNLEDLERFLGFKIKSIEVETEILKSVTRTKSYNNWKDWFTEQDIPFFKELYTPFLKKHNYPLDWKINQPTQIDPRTSSEYVLKLLEYADKIEHRKIDSTINLPHTSPPRLDQTFSIIIPSFNYSWCIDEAIQSVLSQTYSKWELIIVDDGSTDNSMSIINTYVKQDARIKLFYHGTIGDRKNLGLAQTYKLALSKCSGDIIAFLDADDIWDKNYLSHKINVFRKNTDIAVAYNDIVPFGDHAAEAIAGDDAHQQKIIIVPINAPFNARNIIQDRNMIHTFSCFAVRKQFIQNLNLISPIPQWLDWWILAQIAGKGKFYFDTTPLTFWRRHAKSYNRLLLSSTTTQENQNRFNLMKNKIKEMIERI